MTPPHRRTNAPAQSARERVQARRAARRKASWRSFYAAAGVLIGVSIALIVALGIRRADQTLARIQQDDPRRPTAPAPSPPPAATPAQAAPSAPTEAPSVPTATPAATARPAEPDTPLPAALSRPINLLLIGVDKRPDPNDGVRGDTLILVHLDPQARWASMLSIPRDSMVQVPGLGLSKVNAAFSYGYSNAEALYGAGTDPDEAGGALAAETIEHFLKVRVDYVAQVDFDGFARLVDSVGGLIVDVPAPLLDSEYPTEGYGYQRIYIPAGLQVMDGRTALIYARTRHGSTDFERSRRQQQVLQSLLRQIRERGLLENAALLPQWADVLQDNVRTTLPIRDFSVLNGLALLARDLGSDRIFQYSINPDDVAIDAESGSDIYWNEADIAALVARWEAGPNAIDEP